jgi:hypothetical protein
MEVTVVGEDTRVVLGLLPSNPTQLKFHPNISLLPACLQNPPHPKSKSSLTSKSIEILQNSNNEINFKPPLHVSASFFIPNTNSSKSFNRLYQKLL